MKKSYGRRGVWSALPFWECVLTQQKREEKEEREEKEKVNSKQRSSFVDNKWKMQLPSLGIPCEDMCVTNRLSD